MRESGSLYLQAFSIRLLTTSFHKIRSPTIKLSCLISSRNECVLRSMYCSSSSLTMPVRLMRSVADLNWLLSSWEASSRLLHRSFKRLVSFTLRPSKVRNCSSESFRLLIVSRFSLIAAIGDFSSWVIESIKLCCCLDSNCVRLKAVYTIPAPIRIMARKVMPSPRYWRFLELKRSRMAVSPIL
ncbi:hypothetical protein D3C86_1544610 [compost metagenome]